MDLSNIDWSDTEFTTPPGSSVTSPLVEYPDSEVDLSPPELQCYTTSPNARLPIRGTPGSAGLDLFSTMDITVPAHSRVRLPTGLKLAMPSDCFGQICDRSSMAFKKGLHVLGGIIDADYRGEIKVILYNCSNDTQHIRTDDAIAQLIIQRYVKLNPVYVQAPLSPTIRGEGGFGSTSK